MKRKQGFDKEKGLPYEDICYEWKGPELGYVEVSYEDKEIQEKEKENLLINLSRKKRKK